MSDNLTIPQFYVTQFGTNWDHLTQQKPSRLVGTVTPDTVNGEKKSFNQIGTSSMQRITNRLGKTRISDTQKEKRWLSNYPYDVANLFDEWDQDFLGQVVLPTSDTVTSHVFAYNRACDQTIVDALGGTAYSGEEGATANAFSSAQQIAANYVASGTPTNSGLTLAKLAAIKSLFGKNDVDDEEEIFFVYSQQQLDDLLVNAIEVKSADYNNVKALVDGKIDHFMGMTWKRSQLLPKDSSDIRTCYAYVKRAVKFAASGKQTRMDIRADLNHALQIRSTAKLGAVRTEEKLVGAVFCDESV